MKKIILSAILLAAVTASTFANEIKKEDLMTDEMMNGLKMGIPSIHDVVNDYYQAKKCTDNITDKVSTKEIREFVKTYQYSVLIALKTQDTPLAKANYDALINSYKAMNCGSEEAMGTYIGATSAIAVEMNDKKTN